MVEYCTILLNPTTKSDIIAACIQSAAAVQAGQMQAEATRQAGWLGLVAGLSALAAGGLAYRASTAQNRLLEKQRLARERAFTAQICAVAIRAREEVISVYLRFLDVQKDGRNANLDGLCFTSLSLLQDELKPTNWENHALLGSEQLNQITITYETLQQLVVEIHRFSSISLPHFEAPNGAAAALIAKTQCENFMQAIAPNAPTAMRSQLLPVRLAST